MRETAIKYEVAKSTKKQFDTLKKLMNDKEIDTVVNACDAGREGESIFRLVYNEAKCKKKMQRLWISSMEDIAIKEGFDNLKDGKAYDNLFESAQGFRVIIMTQAHSQVNTRVLEQLLQK